MSPNNVQPRLLSVADVAKTLGIGKTSTYQALKSGKLSSLRIGRKRLITADSVERLIAEAAASDLSPPQS